MEHRYAVRGWTYGKVTVTPLSRGQEPGGVAAPMYIKVTGSDSPGQQPGPGATRLAVYAWLVGLEKQGFETEVETTGNEDVL